MAVETNFRILAVKHNDPNALSKDEVRTHAWNEFKDTVFSEKAEELFEKQGIPDFLQLYSREIIKYDDYEHVERNEVIENFPVWIESATGCHALELGSWNFTSEFTKLYEYLGVTGQGKGACVEISKDQVKDMIQVLDYILLGKYDKDIEEMFFENNEFFRVFEEQFFNFSNRFKKPREDKRPVVKVIVKDDSVDREYDDGDYDYNYEGEMEESRKEERLTIQYLKNVLETFLFIHSANTPGYRDPNVEIRLIYDLNY